MRIIIMMFLGGVEILCVVVKESELGWGKNDFFHFFVGLRFDLSRMDFALSFHFISFRFVYHHSTYVCM